jgi:3-hydroxybutyryl-CoA dehydrogenase
MLTQSRTGRAGTTTAVRTDNRELDVSVQRYAVIGAGTMGNGIAHVAALAGRDVALVDIEASILDRAMSTIEKNLGRQVKKEVITQEQADETLGRITTGTDLSAAGDADLVVEAVLEQLEIKQKVWEAVDGMAPEGAILASNTSSISITRLAALTGRPERFIGMHFFNPVPMMKLVEVIRGHATGDEVTAAVMAEAEALGKVPVEVNDYPGFISNRVLMPMVNEAVYALMEGVAEVEAIDTVMKLGMAHPMGPLTLADFIGLDVCLDILEVLHDGLGDPKYRPCPLLRRMVAAGHLGRKSGRGFYDYTEE